LIELVAQTAGICIGWEEHKKKGKNTKGKGWLAGVKEALFYRERIPLGSQIMTEVRRVFDFENYHEVLGMIKADGDLVGKVSVQIVKLVPK
jgi:predicted hotdog family 3-hydroxylacyl-ACP dehydratase